MGSRKRIALDLSAAEVEALVAALDVVRGVEPVKHAAPHSRRIETLRRELAAKLAGGPATCPACGGGPVRDGRCPACLAEVLRG